MASKNTPLKKQNTLENLHPDVLSDRRKREARMLKMSKLDLFGWMLGSASTTSMCCFLLLMYLGAFQKINNHPVIIVLLGIFLIGLFIAVSSRVKTRLQNSQEEEMLQLNDTAETLVFLDEFNQQLAQYAKSTNGKIKPIKVHNKKLRGRFTFVFNTFILALWILDSIQMTALAQPPQVNQVFGNSNLTSTVSTPSLGGLSNSSTILELEHVKIPFSSLRVSILDFGIHSFERVFAGVVAVTWFLLFILIVREFRSNAHDWSWLTSNILQPAIDALILPIFSTLLGALGCDWVDSHSTLPLLIRDPSLYCYTGKHIAIATFALITITVTLPVFTYFRSDPSTKIFVGRIWFLRPFIIISDSLKLIVISFNQYLPRASPYALFGYTAILLAYMLRGYLHKKPACHLRSAFFLKLAQLIGLLSISVSIISFGYVSATTTQMLAVVVPCLLFFLFVAYYLLFLFCRGEKKSVWNYSDAKSIAKAKLMKDVSIGIMGDGDNEYRLAHGDFVLIYNQCGNSEGTIKWGHNLSSDSSERDFVKIPMAKVVGPYRSIQELEENALKDLEEFQKISSMGKELGEYIEEWRNFFLFCIKVDLIDLRKISLDKDSHAFEAEATEMALALFSRPEARPFLLLNFPNLCEMVNSFCDVTIHLKPKDQMKLTPETIITMATAKLAKHFLAYEIAQIVDSSSPNSVAMQRV